MVPWRTLLKLNLFVLVAAAALSLVLFSIVNQVDCIDESGTLGRVLEGKGACMWTWALKFKLTDIMLVKFNTTYEGDWHEGKRHGRGEFVSATGHSYDGEWRNDMRHGQGEYRLSDGIVYSGEWEDNTLMGAGQVKFSLRQPRTFIDYPALTNATTFIGFLKDGFMHGRGAIYLTGVNEKKLNTVEGVFDEGRYIGKGKITLKDGEVVQVALLSYDWNVKTGKFTLPSQVELVWDGSSFTSSEKSFNKDLPMVKDLTQIMQGVHYFESKLAMTRIVVKSEPFNFTQHFEQKDALQQRLMKEMTKKQDQKTEL